MALLGVLSMVAATLGMPATAAHAQGAGVPLVNETFTGATADPEFEGFGNACLTGAPSAPAPGPGTHPLGGCPTNEVGPVPPNDGAPHGYLNLTDAGHDRSAAALYNHALPANQGLVTTFDQWQYGNTTNPPADGISFFLIDGAATLDAPGAFGGSLGYAQKLPNDDPGQPFLPGVNRGYLGVGLDVLGNFFGDWEHRGNGCTQRSPAGTGFHVPAPGANMVTLRGPGHGTEGYCFLDATTSNFSTTGPWPSTLPGQLHGPTTAMPPSATPAEAEALLEPSRRTVTVEVSPAPNPVVTVWIDFHDGNGTQEVLSTPAPNPVPSTYKFGFAGSTGDFTDVHLIRNVTVHPAAALPELNLVKQVSEATEVPQPLTPGQQVPFEYVVTNSGNVTLNEVNVTDDHVPGITCPQTTLASGQSMTCTGTYTVTDADAEAGSVTNTAVAHGTGPEGPVDSPPDEVTLPVQRGPGLRLEKTTDEGREYRVGDEVTYHYTVTNTGPTTLNDIRVSDDHVTGITCEATTLAPDASTGCTGTYTVTEADGRAGSVTNTAVAHGTSDGTPVESGPDQAVIAVASDLSLSLTKSVDDSHPYEVGDEVTYTYTVTNTGDGTLDDLTVTDDRATGITCQATTLAPGASTTCTGTYTVTRADADLGNVTNVAFAQGRSDGTTVQSPPDDASIDVVPNQPGLEIQKVVDSSHPYQVGDTVTYRYTVRNSGNTTIDNVTVADDRVSGITCQDTTLAPGESTECTGTYTVTAADADAGQVRNTAVARGQSDGTEVESPPDSAEIEVGRNEPGLSINKTVDSSHPYRVGDEVTYTYSVTNTGNTTINGVTVADDRVSGITCEATTLAPGASTTCTGTYTVTAADAAAGSVANTAVAHGRSDGTAVESPPDSARIDTVADRPGLSIDKTVDTSRTYAVGDRITYTYRVTNTGNTTISGVTVADNRVSGIACLATTLDPGESTTCTGSYTVTGADAEAGHVANTAVAHGQSDGTTVESPPDSAEVQVGRNEPRLSIKKTVDTSRTYRVGDRITYTYTVTNTGTTTLHGVAVEDDRVSDVTCRATTLAPGGSTTCTGTYTVTKEDAERGKVTNTAVATADGGVRSAPSQATVQVKERKPCKGKDCRPCKGKDCRPCKGKHCDRPCHGKHCDKPCKGKHCDRPCHGKDCDKRCDGKHQDKHGDDHCDKPCDGRRCEQE
ncbi:DUF7507 domain-containing protein [Streptomyces catenulae]|uniref:DUF11 domain-containing protein n=1 Tax=Streptomyces catenulae TaxID=66875 RepID=A0ABV2YXV7_9ACTN|nr:DUF11 domain-containing protein [Streptomyces catenulae]